MKSCTRWLQSTLVLIASFGMADQGRTQALYCPKDAMLEVGHDPQLWPPSGAITIEAWVKLGGSSGGCCQRVLSKGQWNTEGLALFGGAPGNWTLGMDYEDPDPNNWGSGCVDGSPCLPDVWVHAAMTVALDPGLATLYINGMPAFNCLGPGTFETGLDLTFGGDLLGPSHDWEGVVDEVRFWDGLRTDQEIWDSMFDSIRAPDVSQHPSLLASWPFDIDYVDAVAGLTGFPSGTNSSQVGLVPAGWFEQFDCDGNGIPDPYELVADPSLDCDGNGILDVCDISNDPSLDCNNDGMIDSCVLPGDPGLDCNTDGVLDECEIMADPSLDCDGNAILDSCEIMADPSLDCDGDTVLDSCQIAGDPSLDQNGDGVLDSCQCVYSNFCFSTQNSTGQVGTIGWSGSARISTADLTLTGSNLPTNQFGMFFYGAEEWFPAIMGDGLLCIKPPLFRIRTALSTGQSGTVALTLDYGSKPLSSGAGQVVAFSTWRFQLWYRDPTGGPAGSNTTDGLMVTFCP